MAEIDNSCVVTCFASPGMIVHVFRQQNLNEKKSDGVDIPS